MRRRFGGLLLAAVLGTQSARAAEQGLPQSLPIELFTRYDEITSPRLSPDGNHIAYLSGPYGRSLLVVVNTTDKKPVGGVRCPEGNEFFEFTWKSNTRIVYELAERQPGMARPTPTGEMEAINFDGKMQSIVYGYRAGEQQTGTNIRVRKSSYASAEIISPLLSDEKQVLIAEYPWREGVSAWYFDPDAKPGLFRLDTFTGQKFSMGSVPLGNASVLVDAADRARFATGLDENSNLAVVWRPDPDGPWEALKLPGFRDGTVEPRAVSDDNRFAYLTGVLTGQSTSALFKLNLQSGEISEVYGAAGADVDSLVYDFTGRRIVGVVTAVDKPQTHWLDESDKATKIHRAIGRAFPGQVVSIESTTQDGSRALVFVRSDVNPGDYYLFDTRTLHMDYLFASSRWIAPEKMRPKEPIVVKARDEVVLHGYLTRPAGPGPHRMVVLPHGGPHGVRDEWNYDWQVQLLANRGFAVLQLNFRGSDGFGRDFERSGYRQWGAKMQDDLTDATRWAIDNKVADPDRICIFGASYGGYAALMGVVREPKLYRCAIGYAGVYDLELMLSSGDVPRSRAGRAYLGVALGDDLAELRSRSPANLAAQIQVPVLLIHGKEDGRADFKQAKKMKVALKDNDKTFEWMALRREGHGVYDEETRREVYERILTFLDQHLPARAGAAASP